MNYDYVIVGGGSAGSVLAARLSEDPQVRVCLLEAGPLDRSLLIHVPAGLALMSKTTAPINWKFETVPQNALNGRRGYQPRGRVLGGSSSVNAMIYIRGNRADYDGWAAAGNPGWSYDEVLPWFKRSENNERGPDAFHGVGGPLNVMDLRSPTRFGPMFVEAAGQAGLAANADFNGAVQDGAGLYQVTHRNGERCSAAKGYLGPILRPDGSSSRANLTVLTEAHTTRVLFEGQRAVGVEYRRLGGTHIARADREVLLCAGALQSPQLLMLSGVGPADHLREVGVPLVSHSVGVGAQLQDHIDVVQLYNSPGNADLFGISAPGLLHIGKAVLQWRAERKGPLTTNFAEAGGFDRSDEARKTPDLQYHFVIAKLVDHGRSTQMGHGFSCHVCLLDPQSRGTVRLKNADPMAAPLIDPNFLAEPDDMRRLVRGFRRMREILRAPALSPVRGAELFSDTVNSDIEIEAFIRARADTVYHPVGSVRMGPADSDPLDAQLKVKGVEALRVIDASMMPTIVSGNTNAPVIMVAEKLAALLTGNSLALSAQPQIDSPATGTPA